MRLLICGARGSTPAPGAEFVRYGGNTSCVAVGREGEAPRLVLDAGTGLRRLAGALDGGPFRGTILIGHLHWDHTHGLPFFSAGDRADASVRVLIPAQGDTEEVLARAMSPPHFPIRPRELNGEWTFEGLEPGEHEIEGFRVLALEIPHKMSRTFGFRITDGSVTIAYLSDHHPVALGPGPDGFGEYHDAACRLARDVDLLIHDAQYTAAEFPARAHYGHTTVDYAVGLAERCGARRLLLYHHDPPRTDEQLDAIVAGLRGRALPVDAAAEGSVVDLRS